MKGWGGGFTGSHAFALKMCWHNVFFSSAPSILTPLHPLRHMWHILSRRLHAAKERCRRFVIIWRTSKIYPLPQQECSPDYWLQMVWNRHSLHPCLLHTAAQHVFCSPQCTRGNNSGRKKIKLLRYSCHLPESHVWSAVAFIAQLRISNNEKEIESWKLWEVLEDLQFVC